VTWVVLIALALLIACAVTFGDNSPTTREVGVESELGIEATDVKKAEILTKKEAEDEEDDDEKKDADEPAP
jgi:hypothetical protein